MLASKRTTVCLITVTCLYQSVLAQPPELDSDPPDGITCRPSGMCSPCPEEVLTQPYCQPFGNRQAVECNNVNLSSSYTPYQSTGHPPPSHLQHLGSGDSQSAETSAWQSCGRIVAQERADFWEFVACNVFFAIVSLIIFFARSKRMQALQARQLAARIGMVRGR